MKSYKKYTEHNNFNKDIFNLMRQKSDFTKKILIDYINNEDINIQDINGKTLLMTAIEYDQEVLGDLLIKNGIDVNIQDRYGYTALMYSLSGKDRWSRKLLELDDVDIELINQNGDDFYHLIYFIQDKERVLTDYPEKFKKEIRKKNKDSFNL